MKDQLDKLSEELRKAYPGRPSESETRVYVLKDIRNQRVVAGDEVKTRLIMPNKRSLPSSYKIFDPYDQSEKKMEYIEDTIPTGPNALKPMWNIPGNIEFRQDEFCEIRITHDSWPRFKDVDIFLFFSPWLDNNADKPWFLKHKFGAIYLMKDKKTSAILSNKVIREINFARTQLFDMSEEEISILMVALKKGDPKRLSVDEQLNTVLKHYGDPKNAKHLKTLTEDNEIRFRALIKKAQKYGFIKVDASSQQWIWVKGEEGICNKYPGKTLESSLLLFFATPMGQDAANILFKLVVQYELEIKEKKLKKVPEDDQKIDIDLVY